MSSYIDAVLVLIVVMLILLPPRWDPAIRLKEWLDREDRG